MALRGGVLWGSQIPVFGDPRDPDLGPFTPFHDKWGGVGTPGTRFGGPRDPLDSV